MQRGTTWVGMQYVSNKDLGSRELLGAWDHLTRNRITKLQVAQASRHASRLRRFYAKSGLFCPPSSRSLPGAGHPDAAMLLRERSFVEILQALEQMSLEHAPAPAKPTNKPPYKPRSLAWKTGMTGLFGHGACWKYCAKIQLCDDADKSSDAAFRFATISCKKDTDGTPICTGPKGAKLTHPRFDKWTVAQQQAAPVPDE